MSDKERLNAGPEAYDAKALAEAGKEHQERLRENRERAAEKGHENAAEAARHEALEQASRIERESRSHKKREESPAERRGPASKRERDASYDRTMREVRSQMSAPSRVFSSVIHNPVVEKISDVVGGTIARPNSAYNSSSITCPSYRHQVSSCLSSSSPVTSGTCPPWPE